MAGSPVTRSSPRLPSATGGYRTEPASPPGLALPSNVHLRSIAFLGSYPPRQCGIATFTHDLRRAVAEAFPKIRCHAIAVSDRPGAYDYDTDVSFELREQHFADYWQAAEFLRFQNVEAVSVQHEFGIYGGRAGGHLLTFLNEVKLPVVTTLHTILTEPDDDQRQVFNELVGLSQTLVTMTRRGHRMLREIYDVPDHKIRVIPHGIPDIPFVDPAFHKDKYGVEGRKVLLTFGLLSPGKGLEHAIQAMPRIVEQHPDAVYIILGATHPSLLRRDGDAYRLQLQELVHQLGMDAHVRFFDRFVELDELTEFIAASDVYITPYLNEAQITSGTLAYTYGCGKAVVSTPYWHAAELLADGRGELVPFSDPDAIADAVVGLLGDDSRRNAIRKRAYVEGRETTWPRIAAQYVDAFRAARIQAGPRVQLPGPETDASPNAVRRTLQLPRLRMDHLVRLSDSTGLFQHATYAFPRFSEGYCVDDNARGLVAACMIEEPAGEPEGLSRELARTYAAFIDYAFNAEAGRFRNFMSFDRRWLEDVGSEDSHGRVLWSLGCCVGRSHDRDLQSWAATLFERALPAGLRAGSPRTWAFTLLGLHEHRRRLGGVLQAADARQQLLAKLLDQHADQADNNRLAGVDQDAWPWFEQELTYANAKFCHALLVGGADCDHQHAVDLGLHTLDWLIRQQTDEAGLFSPIGSEGFYPRGGERAAFDQQPIEAEATVSACLAAYELTEDARWLREALRAFRWFLGANKLGLSVYDPATGGCRDGLHVDRLNQNQGAESTLAFLVALAALRPHEPALNAAT